MRKEVWYAIFGGIFIGLIIGFGAWRINSAFKTNPSGKPEASPTASPISEEGLTIAKPNSDDVETSDSATISGITSPNAWLVMSNNDSDDYIIQADAKGAFSNEISLDAGVNQIVISAIDKNGNISSQNLRLIYSSQFTPQTASPTPSATPSANESSSEAAIRENVLKKVQEALNNPKAYLGTVTDIAENNIQVKGDGSAIQQVSTQTDDLTVIKTDDTNKEVKFSDIAIGDYIVAMGYRNGNHVLNAKRILIIPALTAPQTKVLYGKIKTIDSDEITLIDLKGKDISVPAELGYSTKFTTNKDNSTVGIKFASLGENDVVIIVGLVKKDIFTARRVHLVESSPQ